MGPIQSGVTVSQYGLANSVIGTTYSWLQNSPLLVLTPSSALNNNLDYVVTMPNVGSSDATKVLKSGFTVGSKPRVQWVKLVSNDGATAVYIKWMMSEFISTPTLTDHVKVRSSSGSSITGKLGDAMWPEQRQYTFFFDSPTPLSSPVTLRLETAITTVKGVPITPQTWDSPTVATDGAFELTLDSSLLASCDTWCWQWTPVIN
jgi:hypothetical protein